MAAGRYGEGNGRRRGIVDSMEKPKVVTRRFDSTPSRCGWGMDGGWTLSDEGDDPGLTDRVGPPVSEREPTAELDKWSRRRPNQTSGAGRAH
jgi:hypothetical protein